MKKLLIPIFIITVILSLIILRVNKSSDQRSVKVKTACGETDVPCETRIDILKDDSGLSEIVINKTITKNTLDIAVFYTYDCPHCKDALAFFDLLLKDGYVPSGNDAQNSALRKYNARADVKIRLNVKRYEVKREKQNQAIFGRFARDYGVKPRGVPSIFIGKNNIAGFYRDTTPHMIVDQILILEGRLKPEDAGTVKIPLYGVINPESISLPVLTLAIGLLDGFNPCAIWVLFFLLGILVYAASRRKVLFIGMTFVIASGAVYFAFMAAWLNFFLVIGFSKIVTVILACAAVIMGLVNVKEIFFYKKGVSLMISDKAKPKLYKKVRDLNKQTNIYLAFVSTMVLAVFVNFIELACTAGFPALFTKILAERSEAVAVKYAYMLLYNLMYVLPLFIIVVVFVITMGHFKMKESHAKILKAVSGIMMILLGVLLLVKPQLLMM